MVTIIMSIIKWIISNPKNIIITALAVFCIGLLASSSIQSYRLSLSKSKIEKLKLNVDILKEEVKQLKSNIASLENHNIRLKESAKKADYYQNLLNNMVFTPPIEGDSNLTTTIKPQEGEKPNNEKDAIFIYNSVINDFNSRVQ